MNDKPLVISLLMGLIVVLVILGVSLLVKMNKLSDDYKRELSKSISLSKTTEDLTTNNDSLKSENASLLEKNTTLNKSIEELKVELDKTNRLKNKLEENLKDELMKNEANSSEAKKGK